MKIENNGDGFTIFLFNIETGEQDIKSYVKKIIMKLKSRISKYLEGYYDAHVYLNKIYGMIIKLEKTGDFDFFKNFLELNIKVYENSKMFYKFKDYFIIINKNNICYYDNNYYVDIEKINKNELLYLSEFGNIIYGKELNNILTSLRKIEMCYNN